MRRKPNTSSNELPSKEVHKDSCDFFFSLLSAIFWEYLISDLKNTATKLSSLLMRLTLWHIGQNFFTLRNYSFVWKELGLSHFSHDYKHHIYYFMAETSIKLGRRGYVLWDVPICTHFCLWAECPFFIYLAFFWYLGFVYN